MGDFTWIEQWAESKSSSYSGVQVSVVLYSDSMKVAVMLYSDRILIHTYFRGKSSKYMLLDKV